uniref:DUF3719 domain-containing protein n=1 Tax=Bombyx mori TaxID=7091 RepID=A0A8R2AQB1_BOMMO|nr:uncharacterized protein LOC101738272 [Bombyx mori]
MSARNYSCSRERNVGKLLDCLPIINSNRFNYRPSQELPPLSARTSSILNRNLNYSFDYNGFDIGERAGTPFSDFFTESETDTPDILSEESDSSSGSALRRNTAEATKTLAEEWERIERTLYDEEGPKSNRPEVIEECKQWRQLHPHFRVIGRAITLPEKRLSYRQIEHEEVIAIHYNDYEQFSEREERLSQSSTDVTPQNSPRVSVVDINEPRLTREKLSYNQSNNDDNDMPDAFSSLLQITPIHIKSPIHKKRTNVSILRSDAASSKWMRNTRPDSSTNAGRSSAKSFASLDTRNMGNSVLSASDRSKLLNGRIVTGRYRDSTKLEPLCSPYLPQNDVIKHQNAYNYGIRKVSLPPLLLEDEKKKCNMSGSGKRRNIKSRKSSKCAHQLDKLKNSN